MHRSCSRCVETGNYDRWMRILTSSYVFAIAIAHDLIWLDDDWPSANARGGLASANATKLGAFHYLFSAFHSQRGNRHHLIGVPGAAWPAPTQLLRQAS